jgi:predicted anti-sigma-YlaC factor YlaD
MNGCDAYSAIIQLYFDQELSGPYMEDVRAHLQNCETCQAQFEAEASLSLLLRRFRPLYFASDALRGRVAQTDSM